MSDPKADNQFISQALELARQGIGLASPNPYVGAVIVDAEGRVVGTGTHTYDGVKHAEILALEQAGERARGGTLFVNLEPCSHVGRTGPCADAMIKAGVRQVVASMPDPNPVVAGRGFEKLRAAGVQVDVGLMQEQARRLNEAFARYIRSQRPLVTLKSAMTLDGKIAPATASPQETKGNEFRGTWITGELARAHAQQLRHEHDAILVGIGTILADDPVLTDRSGLPRRRPLLRVILDSNLRLPVESRIVRSVAQNHDLIAFCSKPDAKKEITLRNCGVEVEVVGETRPGRVDISAVLRRLAELEITSLLIEGGSTVNAGLISSGFVDKVMLYYAPTILGNAAVPFLSETGFSSQLPRLSSVQTHTFGDDLAIEGYLRDPYKG